MKEILFGAIILGCSLIPISVKAETNNYCISKEEFIKQFENTSICLTKDTFYQINSTRKIILLVFRYEYQNTKTVWIPVPKLENSYRSTTTMFKIKDRKFYKWIRNPDAALVNKYRKNITAILDVMEKYEEKPIESF